MADFSVGDVTAKLTADASQFQRTIQQAIQSLQQLSRATTQAQQTQTSSQQSVTQLAQAMQTQVQALGQHAQAMQRSQEATRAFAQQQAQATTAVSQASSVLSNALGVAAGLGIATTLAGVVGAMKDFAASTVETGTRLEALRNSLAALGGSTAAGQQQFQFLTQTANQLGVSLEPLARGWRTLTAAATQANLPLTDQQRLLTALATEARRVGASNEELQRAILAVSQMASKGKISMEELRQQLGEALPTAMAAAARGFGRTTEELLKLIEAGAIRFPSMARALARGFEDLQRESGRAIDGSREAFNRLSNSLVAFKDAIGANVLPEMQRLANIAAAILGTATRLLNLAGGRGPRTGAVGQESDAINLGAGLTANQQKEVERLRALIERYTRSIEHAPYPELVQQLTTMRDRATEQLQQVLQVIEATQQQAAAQAKVTEEANKTAGIREQEADFFQAVRQRLEEVTKAQANFRREAEAFPEVFGRLGGTPEQATQFYQKMQQVTRKQLEDLSEVVTQPPPGAGALPQDITERIAALRREYGALAPAIDALRDKEQGRQRATRDAAQEARQAAQEAERALTLRIDLEANLARVRTFLGRPAQDQAAEARARIEQQGADVQATIERSIKALQDSAALRQLAPALLGQFQEALQQLPEVVAREGQTAFDRVQRQLDTQLLQRRTELETDLARAQTFLGRPAQTPAEEARARVQQQGTELSAMLQRNIAALESDPALAQLSETLLQPFRDALQRLPDVVAAEGEQAYGRVLEQSALEPLRKLAAQYTLTKEARDLDTASLEANTLANTKYAGEAGRLLEVIQAGMQERRTQGLRETLAQLQAPRQLGTAERFRRQAGEEGQGLTREDEALLQQITATERLIEVMGVVEFVGTSAAGEITNALLHLQDTTKNVGQAFARMAQNILQSTAQLLLNKGFQTLIQLGLGALTSAFLPTTPMSITPGGGAYQGAAGGAVPFTPPVIGFQHGGMVTRPTLALVGEGRHNPEYIMNQKQMNQLMSSAMRAGPSAGGQAGGGVSILNFPSRQAAEEEAGRQRGLGREVVLNEVMSDLQRGESSQINRMLRTLQR